MKWQLAKRLTLVLAVVLQISCVSAAEPNIDRSADGQDPRPTPDRQAGIQWLRDLGALPDRAGPGLMPMYDVFLGGGVGCDPERGQVAYSTSYLDEFSHFDVRVATGFTPTYVTSAQAPNFRTENLWQERTELPGPPIGESTMWAVTHFGMVRPRYVAQTEVAILTGNEAQGVSSYELIQGETLEVIFYEGDTYVHLEIGGPGSPGRFQYNDLAAPAERLIELVRRYGSDLSDWWWMLGEEKADPARCDYTVKELEVAPLPE